MARVLTFRYPECGFEVNIPMLPGQGSTALSRQVGPQVSRRHRRECDVCRRRRQERFQERYGTRDTVTVVFRTGVHD